MREAEAVISAFVTFLWYRSFRYANYSGLLGLGGTLQTVVLFTVILFYVYFRLMATHFTDRTLFIAGIADNAYLCIISVLTFRLICDYFILHFLAMFVLISLVRIKTIETDLGSHADMKKVLMWCIIAVIQAAGLIIVLTS